MYQLTSQVYLDQSNECYKKVIAVEPRPTSGALSNIVKTTNRKRLSPFDQPSPCCPRDNCLNIIVNPAEPCEFLCVQDINLLFSYLLANGYSINTQVTKIMQISEVRIPNLICFVNEN